MNPRTLYYNGKIITADAGDRVAEAILVAGDKIEFVGSSRELLSGFPGAARVDLMGRCVIPGLNDGHAHPLMAGITELGGEIPVLKTVPETLEWIRAAALSKPDGEWIYLHRYFPSRVREARYPSLAELDQAAPSHPVFLNGSFAGMVNTCALASSGISAASRHPGLVRTASGELNGVLYQQAFSLLKFNAMISETYSAEERTQGLMKVQKLYHGLGITSVTDTLRGPRDLAIYEALRKSGTLALRTLANYCPSGRPQTRQEVEDKVSALGRVTGAGDEFFRMGPYKVYVDGGILTATAYMTKPWGKSACDMFGSGDSGYRGVCAYEAASLSEVVLAAVEAGFSFAAHCTGDASSLMLLQAFLKTAKKRPVRGRSFQLIHGNFFSDEVLNPARELGAVIDLQGAWFYRDLEALEILLGKERLEDFHPYRRLLDLGLLVCAGSDHMAKLDPDDSVNPYNPFLGIYAMTERTTDQGRVFRPEQALTRLEALKCYTVNNAVKSGEEAIKGSIAPGKLADFAVLDRDYLTCSGDELRRTRALRTVLGGRTVFEAGA